MTVPVSIAPPPHTVTPVPGLAPPSAGPPRRPHFRLPPRRPHRSLGRRQQIVQALIALCAVVITVLSGLVVYAGATMPNVDNIGHVVGTVRILDRNGKLIASVSPTGQARTTITIDQVSPTMRAAVIAAEDRNFYSEGATNPGRVAHALFIDALAGRPEQGASTITEQLARNAFLPQDKSFMRKLREALLADQLDKRYTKDQILAMYLNTVYFGHGAYGVEDAAERYFGVHASQLDLRQSTLLAGLLQAPSADDPATNPTAAFDRQHYVIQGMLATNAITPAQAAAVDPEIGIEVTPLPPALKTQEAANQAADAKALQSGAPPQGVDNAPHFVNYVLDQLGTQYGGLSNVDGDVTVTTSLDLTLQQRAQTAVTNGVAAIGRGANNGAMLVLDSHTGDILAMVGSADYTDSSIAGQYNVVTGARQPGSSFKPLVYEEAFREGVLSPNSPLDDTAQESRTLGGVTDWDNRYLGRIPAARALLLSRNIATEEAMLDAGNENVIAFAQRMGITTPLADNASTGIGTSAVRMIDLSRAYTAFSNGGTPVQPRAILKITSQSGAVIYDAGAATGATPVMTPAQAYAITDILQHYASQWHISMDRPVASKSGTTNNFVDAWYLAYNPDWVVAAWVGNTSGSNPAEQPMQGVWGVDVGTYISAPFIDGSPLSRTGFTPPPGYALACGSACSAPAPAPPPGGGHGDGGGGGGDHGGHGGHGGGGG